MSRTARDGQIFKVDDTELVLDDGKIAETSHRRQIRPQLANLFEQYALIPDGNHDETDNPFYAELERLVELHGDAAVSAIEGCIFEFERTSHDSVYNAIYFCGRMADETSSKECVRVLERVLLSHANSVARLYACEMLGDMGRLDVLEGAYEKETDSSVKFRMARFYLVKKDVKTIIRDAEGLECIERKLMPIFYRSNYEAGAPSAEKQRLALDESISRIGVDKVAAVLRMMISHKMTPQYVSMNMEQMVKKSHNAALLSAFNK